MLAHVLADVGPDTEEHTLTFVVAGPVGVGLAEVTGDYGSVDGGNDFAEHDRVGIAGQDVSAADAALGAHQPRPLQGQENLFQVWLG